ncbi:TetR/AcrR family transcriptional regulator [Cryptosporangium arvum]|uniref:TetR/AcrR family transcriptional regulator n=1 Tax=Cryptosporangium arvum TaxID=80871 RepID=UPI0004B21D15|nr:TetR/AcrR family transcriptional regulator [Cryptosporangium arvum]
MPRRSPDPEERQRDADRSRERLLAAAADEFAAAGYAGARVSSIASRAGLNPQLISYYFGGKAGLYRALGERWLAFEQELEPDSKDLPELISAYTRTALEDPRGARLLLWNGLTDTDEDTSPQPDDAEAMTKRQQAGEIADDLDPRLVQLALMGASLAPVALPQVLRRLTGENADDPEFIERYLEVVRRLTERLG